MPIGKKKLEASPNQTYMVALTHDELALILCLIMREVDLNNGNILDAFETTNHIIRFLGRMKAAQINPLITKLGTIHDQMAEAGLCHPEENAGD